MSYQIAITEGPENLSVVSRNAYEEKTAKAEKNSAILNQTKERMGILPPVVRYISRSGRNILLERPPQLMKVNYYGKPKSEIADATLQEYDIPLPWTVYGICLGKDFRPYSTYVYGAKRSIRNDTDQLYALPLPNCEMSGKFCTPGEEYQADAEEEEWDIGRGINTAYANIWNSNFNTDIVGNIVSAYRYRLPQAIFEGKGDRKPVADNARPKPSNLLKRWEEFEIEELLDWEWTPAQLNGRPTLVRHLIEELRKSDQDLNHMYFYNFLRQELLLR